MEADSRPIFVRSGLRALRSPGYRLDWTAQGVRSQQRVPEPAVCSVRSDGGLGGRQASAHKPTLHASPVSRHAQVFGVLGL